MCTLCSRNKLTRGAFIEAISTAQKQPGTPQCH